MKVAVVSDTNGGMSKELAASLGVYLIPMPIIIDGKLFFEGENITEKEFFEALSSGKDVSTSQPSPAFLYDTWDELLEEKGYDEIVHIPMTSGLSGSCDAAKGYAKDYEGKVVVVDNHRISVTQYLSCLDALKLAKEGKSAEEIKEYLEKTAYEATIYIAVNTLEFLKKGGRISPAVAGIGSLLKIKPILTFQGDAIDSYTMSRGKMDKCVDKMIEAVRKDIEERLSDKQYIVACAGSGLSREESEMYIDRLKQEFPGKEAVYVPLSASISTHTGPGAVGFGAACFK